jgi:RHS repeat-associated protein
MRKNLSRNLLALFGMLVTAFTYAQTPTSNENYVQVTKCLDADCVKKAVTVQYFDGLGRPKQVVDVKATPTGKDVVTHIEYDGFGRQVKNFLPVPQSNTLNGNIVPNPLGNASSVYGAEKIYSEKQLENSPLDRLQQLTQVGNDWSNKPVKMDYEANSDNEVRGYETTTDYIEGRTLSVLKVTNSTNSLNGCYKKAQLYKTTTTDEDGNKNIEFKNGRGQVILVRKVLSDTENADTYYIYNEYNQLAFLIPPKASEAMKNLAPGTQIPDTILNDLCYQYRYDGRDNLVERKFPTKGWDYMVYDKADRLVASQDANLNAQNKWLVVKYEMFGRVVYTGLITAGSRQSLQNQVSNIVVKETKDAVGFVKSGITVNYTNSFLSSALESVLTINYYDTYPHEAPPIPTTILGQYTLPQTTDANNHASTNSLPTATYVKNIEDDNWTKTFTYYDSMGRAIATKSTNYLGGYTNIETELDFTGNPLRTYTYHARKADEAGVTVKERFVYDEGNRLKQHYHQVDSNPEELLADNNYNELSQLTNKKIGGNLQSIDYAYNIRGWLTDVNKNQMTAPDLGGKLFSYKIKYTSRDGIENPDPTQFAGKNVLPRYNGNIAEVDWRSVETLGANPSITPKRYGYAYDKLNRLTAGYYQNPNNPYSKENIESLTYDLNGNVINLYRTSVMEYGSNTATVIDNLAYDYRGNQAIKIKDNSGNNTGYEGTTGFPIEYDANGNMKNMMDKQITGISYNHLNLPSAVNIGFDQITTQINTKYRADGVKLRKENVKNSIGFAGTDTTIQITDYLDGFQYFKSTSNSTGGGGGSSELLMMSKRAFEPQAFSLIEPIEPTIDPPFGGGGIIANLKTPDLQFFSTSEGFYDYTKNQYIYSYRDHLGNVRVSFARNSAGVLEIVDSNDYYPFGMNHLKTGNSFFGQSSFKNYKFLGQELQETGFYDLNARFYLNDALIFGQHDPLSDKTLQPYAYGYNNPIRYVDPQGTEGLGWGLKDGVWNFVQGMQEGDATYQQGGYTSYAEDGSTVENASINGGQVGAVYLGYNANDVAYSENNFTNWNNLHGGDYGSRNEAYLAWQSNPNYHVGESYWDRTFRTMGFAFREAKMDMADGLMFAGSGGRVGQALEATEKAGVMANARALGAAGEEAVGITGAKEGVLINGKMRFPDRLTTRTLEEVKNVKSQSFTKQLRDYLQFSKETNRQMILYTRPKTEMTKPLQKAIQEGEIIHRHIPTK